MMEGVTKKRKVLDSEVTETITAQIGLDKTAEAFRVAHRDRQELIKQWEQTIDQMRKRDQDMDRCANVSLKRSRSRLVKQYKICYGP